MKKKTPKPAPPTAAQLEEWRESRHHENDGTYRGDFGGPAKKPQTKPDENKAKGGPEEAK